MVKGRVGEPKRMPRRPTRPRRSGKLTPTEPDEIVDEAVYLHQELADVRAAGIDVELLEYDGCRLTGADFSGASLDRAMFSDCVLERCDLSTLGAHNCSLVRVECLGARMLGTSWTSGTVREVTFEECRMDMASFRFTNFSAVWFVGCRMVQADLTGANLRGARFLDCDLSGVQLAQAEFAGAWFSGCTLDGLRTVNRLRGATVDEADLLSLAHAFAAEHGIDVAVE